MKVSLRTKWAALMLVVALLPVGVLASVTIRIQRNGLETAEKELETAIVDDASREVVRHLYDVTATTHRVAVILSDPRVPDDAREVLVVDTLRHAGGVGSVAVFDATGAFIDAIVRDADVVPGKVPALKAPHGGWVSSAATGEPPLRYIEVLGDDAHPRGFVATDINLGALTSILHDLADARFGARGHIALVDDGLRVIAESSASADARRGNFGMKKLPPEGISESLELVDAAGTLTVGTVRTLPKQALAVVVERPEADAFRALGEARRAFSIAALAAALFALITGFFFASRITTPIASLVRLARAYGARELDKRSDVKTGDELEVLGDALTDMAESLTRGEKEIARRAAVEVSLSRYMPAAVAAEIANGAKPLALGGERKEVSIVFADVASFTAFAESSPPEIVTAFLNELFSVLSEVVFRHDGMVDKFMGDCIMAVFGADDSSAHAGRAVACAEDMQRFVSTSAPGWKDRFGLDVRLGIGVATGAALVGNLGSETRMEYTVIGDAVNVASRLEGIAQPGQILVTYEVSAAVGDEFPFLSLGLHPIRGKQQSIEILELST